MASSAGNRRGPPGSTEGSTLVPGPKSKMRNPNKGFYGDGGPDPSVLRPSIAVSVTGVKQTLQALENGTQEVRDYLFDECHVIYECRTCLNMFRSVANFIAHKRSYCTTKLKNVRHVYRRDPPAELDMEADSTTTAFVEPEPVETIIPDQEWDLRDYSPSLELLREAGLIQEIESKPLVTSLKKDKSLSSIVGRLRWKAESGVERDYYRSREREATTYLMEPMRQTTQAVFQTPSNALTSMGSRYVELERLKRRPSVFIGPDGKIVDPGEPPPRLAFGSSSSHQEPTCFPCPLCKRTFVTSKGVLRHAMRFHEKDLEGAKAVRKQSKKMAYVKQNNVKKPYDPMCFGCGKKFVSPHGISIHQGYCYQYKNRAFSVTSARAVTIMNRPPVVRIRQLDNQAVRAALARRSSNDEAHLPEVLIDSVNTTSPGNKNDPTEARSKVIHPNEATLYDDLDEKMSGSSGIGSNEENDCNVENINVEINKPSSSLRKPIVHLPRIRSRAETPASSRSNSPAPTKKRKRNEEELSSQIMLNQTGLSEMSGEGRSHESFPASDLLKKTQADGDDDEITFKISPVLEENVSGHQLVAPRLKRSRIENEEEEETAKIATEEDAKTAETPKRTQRSIFQWLKKTPAAPSAVANTNKRTSNSSRGSSGSIGTNSSEGDFGTKLSAPDPPSSVKRKGAKLPLVSASGSENDAVAHPTVAMAAATKQRTRSTKAMKS